MSSLPKISVITIVLNDCAHIEGTILSVINQTYKNIEFVVVDGGSSDGTLDVIKQYDASISSWVSEDDKGLYDAMNKGMSLATGDYYWFINSGDQIAGSQVLEQAIGKAPFADIYYGDTVMIDEQGNEIGQRRLMPPKNLTWQSFKNGMLVSHQSIIISKLVAPKYNLAYRFSADFEWCLLSLKKATHVMNTQITLSRFLDGGITKQNIVPGLKERFRIMREHFGFLPTLLRHMVIGSRFILYVVRFKRF